MGRVLFFILLFCSFNFEMIGACDFTTTQSVVITPDGNHNAAAGYTQIYVLTDENGVIVATSATGDFGVQNFGSYDAYAFNYEIANAPTVLPAVGIDIASINDGCASFSAPLAITVCESSVLTACEDSGDDIIIALSPDYNMDAAYNQVVVVVDDASGQILFVSNLNAATGTVNYTTSASGDLPNGSYTVYAVNYENTSTLAGLGLVVGNAWVGTFGSACADASTGTAIQVDLCTVICGTCTNPDCLIAGPYPDYGTAAAGPNHCSQINDISATPINGTTFTSYHQLTSSATGTVGVVISVGVNAIVGGTPCPVTRVATLYPIGGPCNGATAITFTTTTANGSPFYNPEWTGLLPNTDYVLEVTFSVPAGCEMVDHCESFYAPSCNNAIGTVTVTGGTNVGANEYELTDCETINFSVSGQNLGEGVQFGWAVFNCAPTLPLTNAELQDLTSNPCYVGSDYGTTTSDVDAGGISGTISGDYTQLWILPYISEAADQPDANNNGCYAVGTPVQINYIPPTCGDCAAPTCAADNVGTFANRTYNLCNDPCADLNNMTYVTYHTVTTDANGNVGVVQTVSAGCNVTRTAVLRDAVNSCAAADIPANVANANGVGSGFNPEWTGLSPNTNYTLIITTIIPAGCNYDYACVDFYGINCPASTGTVSVVGGTNSGTDEYTLTDCETITFTASNEDLNGGILTYGWAIFDCQPVLPFSAADLADFGNNPCYLGSDYGLTTSDNDAAGISGTIPGGNTELWVVPYTSDVADAADSDGDGCFDIGTPIHIIYTPPTCGDCAAPTCAADNVLTFDDRTYNLCNDPCADLNNMTYVTYHTVTTDANGNVGVVQTVSAGCNVTRTAVLRDATNSCAAADIPANITNANGVGSGFNPEWTGLSPNTNYTLIITTIIPAGCNYDYACVDFYGIPQCGADAGITTALTSNNTNNDYVLCWGESIDFTTAGFVLPSINMTGNEAFGYAVYTDPMPGTSPNTADADFVEYLIGTGVNASLTITNDGSYTPPFINNLDQTLYFYPITMDDGVGQDHDVNGDNCFDVGQVITVTFLNEITFNITQDCLNDASVYAIDGGYLEFFVGNYNVTNLGDGQLSSATVNTAGGNTSVTNLIPGNNHYLDIVDDNGCTLTTLPQLYPVDLFFDSINFINPTCSYLCDAEVSIYADNATQFSVNNTPLQANNVFNNICSGVITVTIEDNGCVVDSVITITAPAPVTIVNSLDNIICIGSTEPLTANASGGTGPNYGYYWDNVLGASINNVSPVVTTTYDVYALDANGCSSDTNQIVIDLLEPLTVTTNLLDSICLGENIDIYAVAAGGDGNYSYNWTNNDGTGWTANGATVNVSPTATTEYYLTLTDGCTTPAANETVTIQVNDIPAASFTADTLQGCYPLIVSFENTSTGNLANNCSWTINGEIFNGCGNQSYTFDDVGCYDVSLSVTSISGCTNVDTQTNLVCVYEYPVAYFEPSSEVVSIFNPNINFTNLSTDNYSNDWLIMNVDEYTSVDVDYTYPEVAGMYDNCLTVTNQYGCTNTYCQEIEVEDEMTLYVPNAFTPDGNGDNEEFFVVINQDLLDEFELLIFNRWGQMILKSTSPSTRWDGTYQGQNSPEDVYVWVVRYKQLGKTGSIEKRGHVSLIR